MRRNQTARQHNFATVPREHIQRSRLYMPQTRKLAFNASEIVVIQCEEVMPGDIWEHRESIMARLATPIAPAVDDIDVETFYFFEPNRIAGYYAYDDDDLPTYTQQQWEDFITGVEQTSVPVISPAEEAGPTWPIPVGSIADYMGIPVGAFTARMELNAFPFWAYFHIYNEYFRDQNLQGKWYYGASDWDTWTTDDDVPLTWDGMPLRACKRSDYFTRSLPFAQKGSPVTIPIGATAPVVPVDPLTPEGSVPTFQGWVVGVPSATEDPLQATNVASPGANVLLNTGAIPGPVVGQIGWVNPNLQVNLAAATAITINAIRLAAQTQKLLELDARGGSRYVEQLLVHFGVRAPDFRLNRPEYLGGSKIPITVNPIAQTAAYDAEPADAASAVGNLGAEMHASGSRRTYRYAATEHGYIIGLAVVRATPTYQQGLRRHWLRNTRLDFPWPVFANLGEQAVDTREIYLPTDLTPAVPTWGFQGRYDEMRMIPNEICGHLRSTSATPMDWWHYAEEFANEPGLNAEFITDKTQETLARSLATAPSAQWQAQIIMDIRHDNHVARLLPMFGVPGIDKF